MRVVSISAKPVVESVEPAIVLLATFGVSLGERVPLGVSAIVKTEDKKILAVAHPTSLGEKASLDAREFTSSETHIKVPLLLQLGQRALDHLEGLRPTNRKGDVVLNCELEAQFLVSKVVNADLVVGDSLTSQGARSRGQSPKTDLDLIVGDDLTTQGGRTLKSVAYAVRDSRESFYSQTSNMWVLSGQGGRTFLERDVLRHSEPITIGASDWIHDYVAAWKGTRFLVVELPQPDLLASASSPTIAERVNAAIEALQKAGNDLAKGDWNDVVESLRPVWELLRNQADIQGLLQQDGYPPDAVAAFNESVKNQFELASKFIHRVDKSGKKIAPEIKASREDALLVYSLAAALLNLVTRKATRLQK
jgi:hypothetical protein